MSLWPIPTMDAPQRAPEAGRESRWSGAEGIPSSFGTIPMRGYSAPSQFTPLSPCGTFQISASDV
jgi:hypothetical protein